jgi:ankyrin repeat protein
MKPLRRGRYALAGAGVALCALWPCGALHAQNRIKAVTEIRYPTAFETQPITVIVDGKPIVVGQSVTPTEFTTREVGADLNVHEVFVTSLNDILVVMNGLGDNGDTALMYAVYERHSNVVRRLVGAGAEAMRTDRNGVSALALARSDENRDMIRLLTATPARQPAGGQR